MFIITKTKKPDPDNILASGTEKLVRDDSKSFNISFSLPQGGATFTRNNLSFAGKQHTIGDLGVGIWKSYFRVSGNTAALIKNEYDQEARQQEIVAQGGDPQRAAASRDTGITVTDIEESIEAIEKDGENVVAIYDELYKGIEKTYAVPV